MIKIENISFVLISLGYVDITFKVWQTQFFYFTLINLDYHKAYKFQKYIEDDLKGFICLFGL